MAWRLTDDEAMAAYDSVIEDKYHFDHEPTFEEARDAVIKMRLKAVTQEQLRQVAGELKSLQTGWYQDSDLELALWTGRVEFTKGQWRSLCREAGVPEE